MVQSTGDMERAHEPQHRPITVAEFNTMVETGIIAADERVELVDGELIVIPPMNPPHASIVARFVHVLLPRLSAVAVLWPQLSVVTSEWSQPQPDIGVMRPRPDFYSSALPRPDDMLAVVEVSDSSLAFDRGRKLVMYAKASVPEYWVVDVDAATIEICREPHELGYASRTVARRGETVSFAAFADVTFAVGELLG